MELLWPESADEPLRAGVHRIFQGVVEQGGAIGFLVPPGRDETDEWLDGVLDRVKDAEAALVVAAVDGDPVAFGTWRRGPAPIFVHSAELQKIMTHPTSRGSGLGGTVIGALVDNARAAGIETLTLGVRGNNHGAIGLYERFGFREWGRLPNVIEVGDLRFDDVKMYLELGRPPGLTLHGSRPGGPGSSDRRTR